MSRILIAPHQPLPRGWRWGAHRRDGCWWLVGPNGRSALVEIVPGRTPVPPKQLRSVLMRATEPDRSRQVQRDR